MSASEYEKWERQHKIELYKPNQIGQVKVDGFKRVDRRSVEDRISLKQGNRFDLVELGTSLNHIYRLGDYERVDFTVSGDPQAAEVQIRAVEKRNRGPHYLHFGVTWDAEVKGKQDGTATMNLQLTRLNRLNAESVTDITLGTTISLETEFRQPLDYSGTFFVAPHFSVARLRQDYYSGVNRAGLYEIDAFRG